MFDLDFERAQLLLTWKRAFRGDVLAKQKSCFNLPAFKTKKQMADNLRQAHNFFGWMAGNALEKRGLCSGAIYRSENFMNLQGSERNGSAGPRKTLKHLKNIHIEHTIPIAELTKLWGEHYSTCASMTVFESFAWVLTHSIATAVDMTEQGSLGRYESRSDVFELQSTDFGLPFKRYDHLEKPPTIWNVWLGEKVDPDRWSLADNLQMALEIMKAADVSDDNISQVRDAAQGMLTSLNVAALRAYTAENSRVGSEAA